MPTLSDAIALSSRGWRIFPVWWPVDGRCACRDPECASPGKHPPVRWRDVATTDVRTISGWWRRWPEASIGLATGAPSGVFVVDLDGDEGIRQWDRLCSRHGHPRTVEAVTGGGGRHLYFAEALALGNSSRRLGPGVDTRGTGGYVLAPPSGHVSGRCYRWAKGRAPSEIALLPLPWWLERELRRTRGEPVDVEPRRAGETSRYGGAALERITAEMAMTGRGKRNHVLFQSAARVAELVAGGEIAEAEGRHRIECAAEQAGLSKREIRQTLESGWRAGSRQPRRAPERRSA